MFSSKANTYAPLPNGEQKSEIVDFNHESVDAGAHTEATASLIALRQAAVRNLLTTILAFYSVAISVVLFATLVNFVEKENHCNIGPYPAWKEFARMYALCMICCKNNANTAYQSRPRPGLDTN